MDLPLSSVSANSAYGLQTSSINNKSLNSGIKNNTSEPYYAKKGEPMYMKEMDADEDGVVSLDEFRDYCKENNISTKQMINMVQMASNYRTLQAEEEVSKNIENKTTNNITPVEIDTNTSTGSVYAEKGDSKYDPAMDSNSDDKITYKEYLDYCKEHAKTSEKKSDTKVEQTDDGSFKTSSASKAANAYAASESEAPEGKYEFEA